MCFEVILPMLAGGVMSAVGGGMTQDAQEGQAEAQAKARNRVLSRVLKRNDGLARDSRRIFDKNVDKYSDERFAKRQDAVTENRIEPLVDAVDEAAPEEIPLSGSAPDVVKSELAQTLLDAMNYGKKQATQLGEVGGYGDAWLRKGITTSKAANRIGMKQNFAGGNLSLLPFQQDMAEVRSVKPISPLGGILQGLGHAVGGMSFGGGGSPYTSIYQGGG